jgi:hypothetical protein
VKKKMAVARKKMSKSGYILIILAVIAMVALPILHIVGVIDLTFLSDGLMGVMMWGSMSPINSVIIVGSTFAIGMFTFYMLKGYLIGEKQVMYHGAAAPYNPMGQTISPQQQHQNEVTVS